MRCHREHLRDKVSTRHEPRTEIREAWRKNNRAAFVDEKLARMLWDDIGLKTLFIFRNRARARDDDDDDER